MSKKLQVFISSTFEDLKQERQAAVAAVLKAGHIPAGMELFTSGDQSQLDTIKAWIDESDVYMLILGGRYGTIESKSKKSYTELEFDYAVSKNKPLFSVVIMESALEKKVKDSGSSVIEKKNGVLLERFRDKVLTYVSSFYDDLKDIRLTVYESLADFSANKDLVGWVRGNTVIDTVPLFEEIKKLSEENINLRSSVTELTRQKKSGGFSSEEIRSIQSVLESETLTIPGHLCVGGKSINESALDLFLRSRNSFATGIENDASMSRTENYLFFKLAPLLQIHGLVDYEKVAGARYRRCALTPKGASFLSSLALQAVEKGQIPALQAATAEEETPQTVSPAGTKKKARAPRKTTVVLRELPS